MINTYKSIILFDDNRSVGNAKTELNVSEGILNFSIYHKAEPGISDKKEEEGAKINSSQS